MDTAIYEQECQHVFRYPAPVRQEPDDQVPTDGLVTDEYGWYVVHTGVNWWAVLWLGLWVLVLTGAVAWVVWS